MTILISTIINHTTVLGVMNETTGLVDMQFTYEQDRSDVNSPFTRESKCIELTDFYVVMSLISLAQLIESSSSEDRIWVKDSILEAYESLRDACTVILGRDPAGCVIP